MWIDVAERWVRRAGAISTAVGVASVYAGLWRQSHHRTGRMTDRVPSFMRPLLDGSFSFYLLMSGIGFGILAAMWRPIGISLSVPARAASLLVGSLLFFPGIALLLWARLTMGRMHAVSTGLGAKLYSDHRLVTGGPFAFVRHPMYVGGVLCELGALLIYRTWSTLLISVNAFSLMQRSRVEDKVLGEQFGEKWTEYQRRVPGWIPRIGA